MHQFLPFLGDVRSCWPDAGLIIFDTLLKQLMSVLTWQSVGWWTEQGLWPQMGSGFGFRFSHFLAVCGRHGGGPPLRERFAAQLLGSCWLLDSLRLPQLHRAASSRFCLFKDGPHPWLIEVGL